jgi:signal transduction histidine kinase
VSGERLEHAVAAFLRQEFGASVAAIIGFLDILIEDARPNERADIIPDLERMREAGAQLSALTAQAVDSSQGGDAETARLRHDLRTPLNAIKGYGELLVEEAQDCGRDTLLDDLRKVLELAERLLGEIDRLGETTAVPPIDIVGTVLQTIKPLGEAERYREPHPRRRRQRVQPRSAGAPTAARGTSGHPCRDRRGRARVDRRRGLRPRAPRSDDAGDERIRGAVPA